MRKISHSRMYRMRRCHRMDYYRSRLGLEPVEVNQNFALGTAMHNAIALWDTGTPPDEAIVAAITGTRCDEKNIAVLHGLFAGYCHRYHEDANLCTHQPEVRIESHVTGLRGWRSVAIIDDLATTQTGKKILFERKTTSEDVSDTSEYWERVRHDTQVLYYSLELALQRINVQSIWWDAIRKPTIRQKQNETLEEYSARLALDCQERPDFYFARREMPILENDLAIFAEERKNVCLQIAENERREKRFANPCRAWARCGINKKNCGGCEFRRFCFNNIEIEPGQIPDGFQQRGTR